MADGKVLQCGIVGAGVAGLCAAIALRRAGHDVEVYERSHFKQEIGAAITLGPNANRVLHTWGFDPASADTTDKRQLRRLKWDTLEVLYQESYDHVLQKYGYPFNAFHRVDLHKVLREMATEKHGAHISLGMGVKEVDCKGGKITFENGETAQKDLVIIADGIRVSWRLQCAYWCQC